MLGLHKAQPAAAAAFNPATDVADCYAAWMANKGLSSGASWTGQAAGRVLSQSTTGNQPVYIASDTDGKPSLSFNGINQFLIGGSDFSLPGDPALTIFLVCQPASIASGAYSSPFGFGNGSGTGTAMAILLNYVNGGQPSVQTGGGNGVSFPANLTTTWQQYTFQKTPGGLATTTSARRNGVAQTPLSNTSSVTPAYTTGTLWLGVFANAAAYHYSGKLRELLIYTRALSTAEMGQVESYLASKWGL